jgi:phosphoenolpyruvate-protein kinase (PTS system EI component)
MRVQPSAVVLSEPAAAPGARALLTLAAVPAVVEVGSLFRWVTEGELALVDGDHGLVRLNPSRTEVATFRSRKRQADKP